MSRGLSGVWTLEPTNDERTPVQEKDASLLPLRGTATSRVQQRLSETVTGISTVSAWGSTAGLGCGRRNTGLRATPDKAGTELRQPRTTPLSAADFAKRQFDFVVVGGGTAGLAVASRLAAAQPSLTVGVLEAGGVSHGEDDIDIPAFYGRALGGRHDWGFETEPQPGLGGRTLPWPRGKVLGGTSALNFMAWNRASKDDYDAWEALGNAGWGWNDLLPFFKKSETFHIPSDTLQQEYDVTHDRDAFGTSGPIQVSYSTDYSPSHRLWHQTLNALGVKTNPAHVAGSNVGVWTNVNAVDPRTASRCYSTSYCSSPAPNLHILTEATVQEIVLDGRDGTYVATGVRFTHCGEEHIVSVTREVILSAGSVKSPQVLELSGIGNPSVLETAGVPVKVNSPQVGENLQDHLMLAMIFEVDSALENPDRLKTDKSLAEKAMEKYLKDRDGPLTVLPCSITYVPLKHFASTESLAALSAKAADMGNIDPDKQAILRKRLDGTANLGQIEYIFDLGNWSTLFKGEDDKQYGTMLQILQYPFSFGSIHIQKGGSGKATSEDKPRIDPAYYGGDNGRLDIDVMKECVQFARNISSTEPLAGIIHKPASPDASTLESDSKLQEWIVGNTITDWHPVGTCGMGGRKGIDGGVVDERLRVYGVAGLRVVDASVMPLQISAHLQATVYAIAEKGAQMILEDLRG
ncbi:glucose oxidase [Purpureocillium lavendulum]|uniref:Glucose oxidase n=1 Tax=Purpureocillium lavendulum TaxID=1247861 RepID=A0AB34FSP5_9HYPO|nr:glucose oxidase [Purpureocillium lavendulum]